MMKMQSSFKKRRSETKSIENTKQMKLGKTLPKRMRYKKKKGNCLLNLVKKFYERRAHCSIFSKSKIVYFYRCLSTTLKRKKKKHTKILKNNDVNVVICTTKKCNRLNAVLH